MTLEVSYIGYETQQREVNCEGANAVVSFALETLVMKEAIVVTDIAIDRKTPVAFTNVLPAQIQEELAVDLPMVLNTTPVCTPPNRVGRWRYEGDHPRV